MVADKLFSFTTHDDEGKPTIHPRIKQELVDEDMGDIPTTKTKRNSSAAKLNDPKVKKPEA